MKASEYEHVGSFYTKKNIAYFEENVDKLVKAIEESKIEFDSIAFCGMSSVLYAPTVAYILGKELLLVRKNIENCHSSDLVEGYALSEKYIIIDDIVASGGTIVRIIKCLKESIISTKCQAVFRYNSENNLSFNFNLVDVPVFNL